MRVKIYIVLVVAFCIVSAGYLFLHREMPALPLTPEDKNVMNSLFANPKSQCLGRYIFDVPDTFTNTLQDSVKINDARIASKRLYRPAFEQRIRLREQELKNGHTVNSRDKPFLKQVYALSADAIIFDRNKNESVPGFGRTLEGHIYSNGVAFIVQIDITDYSDEIYTEDRELFLSDGASKATANTKPQKLAEMQDLLSRLSGRKDDEIPTQSGTCIPDGFIRDGGKQDKEVILFAYKNADFILGVKSDNTLEKDISLLDRGMEIEKAIRSSNSHTMHKGKVKLPGIEAEEWLIRGRQEVNDKVVDYYSFTLYGNENVASYHSPIYSVVLHNRSKTTTNYSDAQLVDIWDRITRTFRFRPGAF